MRCPTLEELPAPPSDRTGWPWTEESTRVPDRAPDGRAWPQVSVVTPSYNQGDFLEETIRSVLLQGYPNLDYTIMDGGSRDNSVEIIKKYERWMSAWVSEPDGGQAQAINKGFRRCSGTLLGWINSDDALLPDALGRLAREHVRHPDSILLGDVLNLYPEGQPSRLIRQWNVTFDNAVECWNSRWTWHQPGMYVPTQSWRAAGELDENLRYLFDRDWLCRLTRRSQVHYLGVPVAQYRLHPAAKHGGEAPGIMREHWTVTQRYWDEVPGLRKRWVQAVHAIREASVYLALDPSHAAFWDRGRGARMLWTTFRDYPGIVRSRDFWRLCGLAAFGRRPDHISNGAPGRVQGEKAG